VGKPAANPSPAQVAFALRAAIWAIRTCGLISNAASSLWKREVAMLRLIYDIMVALLEKMPRPR
jgi:hypothetical protein